MGAEDAIVEVEPLPETRTDVARTAREVLEELLPLMDLEASVAEAQPFLDVEEEEVAPVALDIEGDDLGILIGRHGQTLSCLQYMVRLIVGHRTGVWAPITIDVEGYKKRRSQSLQDLALRVAEQVRTRRAPITLKPMPAYERRVIHQTLSGDPLVTTQSTGEGEYRRVVVLLRQKR